MTAFSQRIVPTLTEVLDAADLYVPASSDGTINGASDFAASSSACGSITAPAMVAPEPALIDALLRQSIEDAVDAVVADLRARLLPQVEALIQQALEAQVSRTR